MIIDTVDIILTAILDMIELAASGVDMSANILVMLLVALRFCGHFSFVITQKAVSSFYSSQKKNIRNLTNCFLRGSYDRSWIG